MLTVFTVLPLLAVFKLGFRFVCNCVYWYVMLLLNESHSQVSSVQLQYLSFTLQSYKKCLTAGERALPRPPGESTRGKGRKEDWRREIGGLEPAKICDRSPPLPVVIEFGKRHDTTDFCPWQLVTDLVRGNWCNGFWLLVDVNMAWCSHRWLYLATRMFVCYSSFVIFLCFPVQNNIRYCTSAIKCR